MSNFHGGWRQGPSCPAGRGKIAGPGPRNSERRAPAGERLSGRGETGCRARTQGGREPQRGWMPRKDSRPTEDNARIAPPRSIMETGDDMICQTIAGGQRGVFKGRPAGSSEAAVESRATAPAGCNREEAWSAPSHPTRCDARGVVPDPPKRGHHHCSRPSARGGADTDRERNCHAHRVSNLERLRAFLRACARLLTNRVKGRLPGAPTKKAARA